MRMDGTLIDSSSEKNIIWHQNIITRRDREKLNKHKAMLLWFTGLSGSGKSTLSNALEQILYQKGIRTFLLDGDNIRHGLNRDLSFSAEDRRENIRRITEVGKLFVDAGIVVLVAAISPYRKDREEARSRFEEGRFIEIYVKCPLEVCEKRDPKGLYKKARNGEIENFTGISQAYEEPLNPELTIDTSKVSLDEALATLTSYVLEKLRYTP